MSGHDASTDGHVHEKGKPTFGDYVGNGCLYAFGVAGVLLILSIAFGIGSCAIGNMRQPIVVVEGNSLIHGITPASMIANFEFNIEADRPVKITYDDGQSYVYRPGVGCIQGPTPHSMGPKTFTDPDNEKEGHIPFRLYRLRSGEGTCK